MSTSERWIAVGGDGAKFALVRLEDRTVEVCDPGLGNLHEWRVGQTPDGRALIFVKATTLELVRYELP
jgi:hypothetical protein